MNAQGGPSSLPGPGGPGEATSSAASTTAEGGVHLCMALHPLPRSRLVYLFQPRAACAKAGPDVCSDVRVSGHCTGPQYYE